MPELTATEQAWRRKAGTVSLPEVHRSVLVPPNASFLRKLLAFSGPGFLVAVGYMDPGNWATDLAGGANFRQTKSPRNPSRVRARAANRDQSRDAVRQHRHSWRHRNATQSLSPLLGRADPEV